MKIIRANGARGTPNITLRNATEQSLRYVLRFLTKVAPSMPNTRSALRQAYERGLNGEIFVTEKLGSSAGATTNLALVPGGTGVGGIVDVPGTAPDFTIGLDLPTIRTRAALSSAALVGQQSGSNVHSWVSTVKQVREVRNALYRE